jgi:hypothetical protein
MKTKNAKAIRPMQIGKYSTVICIREQGISVTACESPEEEALQMEAGAKFIREQVMNPKSPFYAHL